LKRNRVFSFPFLKENGELLGIAANTGFLIEPRALELYQNFYDNALKLTEFYPQYYRFMLGMTLDLEKVGMRGQQAQNIARHVCDEGLVLFDTSDTRRLETLTMLRQIRPLSDTQNDALRVVLDNVDQLISNPNWYTKFNKPLFYDLTHIIFFLTNNGNSELPLKNDIYPCLMFMGLLSLLDNDADLLGEICICLEYIGRDIPPYWDEFLQSHLNEIEVSYSGTVSSALNTAVDEYHIYFVLNWYQAIRNRTSFHTAFDGRTPSFSLRESSQSILSKLAARNHEFTFGKMAGSKTLEDCISGLNVDESNHWDKTMDSTSLSESLLEQFS